MSKLCHDQPQPLVLAAVDEHTVAYRSNSARVSPMAMELKLSGLAHNRWQ